MQTDPLRQRCWAEKPSRLKNPSTTGLTVQFPCPALTPHTVIAVVRGTRWLGRRSWQGWQTKAGVPATQSLHTNTFFNSQVGGQHTAVAPHRWSPAAPASQAACVSCRRAHAARSQTEAAAPPTPPGCECEVTPRPGVMQHSACMACGLYGCILVSCQPCIKGPYLPAECFAGQIADLFGPSCLQPARCTCHCLLLSAHNWPFRDRGSG